MSPTQRTLKALRESGLFYWLTEHWCSHTRRRKDLLGFIDLIALDEENGRIIGIQVTSGSNHAARRNKILTEKADVAQRWLRSGGVIQVRSWKQYVVERGKPRKEWRERIEEITLGEFDEQV